METLRAAKSGDTRHREDEIATLAVQILGFIGSDSDRLIRFLDTSGVMADSLRARMADVSFQGGLLDYLMQDEPLLTTFAAEHGQRPEKVAAAIVRLRGIGD